MRGKRSHQCAIPAPLIDTIEFNLFMLGFNMVAITKELSTKYTLCALAVHVLLMVLTQDKLQIRATYNNCQIILHVTGAGTSPTAIAALTSTVNRTTTNLQPLVPIGTQLQQPQFQVRMVQFPQQGGPAQIQCQPTIVQSPRGATPVQIHTQAQVVQGLQQVESKTLFCSPYSVITSF